jgi:hypothetical protein
VSASAVAASRLKDITYHGYRVAVPRSWPVYDLARDPGVCVRFDRHAIYLGRPSSGQRCPAHAAGRTEAILLAPLAGQAASAGTAGSVSLPHGGAGSILSRAHGLLVTATWNRDPALIRHALGLRSLHALSTARSAPGVAARIAAVSATPGGVYTGLGFDAHSRTCLPRG